MQEHVKLATPGGSSPSIQVPSFKQGLVSQVTPEIIVGRFIADWHGRPGRNCIFICSIKKEALPILARRPEARAYLYECNSIGVSAGCGSVGYVFRAPEVYFDVAAFDVMG